MTSKSQGNFFKELEELHYPKLKTYYKTTAIKTMWHWQGTDIKTHQFTSDKGTKVNDAGTSRYLHENKINNNPYLTPNRKMNSKWITDLKKSAKTIKLLEENMKENLCDMAIGTDFR